MKKRSPQAQALADVSTAYRFAELAQRDADENHDAQRAADAARRFARIAQNEEARARTSDGRAARERFERYAKHSREAAQRHREAVHAARKKAQEHAGHAMKIARSYTITDEDRENARKAYDAARAAVSANKPAPRS